MGEAQRRKAACNYPLGQVMPGQQQQVQFDLKNAKQKVCECGCKYFQQVIEVYVLSAILSPTGKELPGNRLVLVCSECKKPLNLEKIEK